MTDLELLTSASAAAHGFFDAVTRGEARIEDATERAIDAFNSASGHAEWWKVDIEQRAMYRYHFAVKLFALGLAAEKPTSPK